MTLDLAQGRKRELNRVTTSLIGSKGAIPKSQNTIRGKRGGRKGSTGHPLKDFLGFEDVLSEESHSRLIPGKSGRRLVLLKKNIILRGIFPSILRGAKEKKGLPLLDERFSQQLKSSHMNREWKIWEKGKILFKRENTTWEGWGRDAAGTHIATLRGGEKEHQRAEKGDLGFGAKGKKRGEELLNSFSMHDFRGKRSVTGGLRKRSVVVRISIIEFIKEEEKGSPPGGKLLREERREVFK